MSNVNVNATEEQKVNEAMQATEQTVNNDATQGQETAKKDSFFSKLGNGIKANKGKIAIGIGTVAAAGAAWYFGVPAAKKFISEACSEALDGHRMIIGVETLDELNKLAAPVAEAATEVVEDVVESAI